MEPNHERPPEPQVKTLPPTKAEGRGPGWFRGDLHVHSRHSHGGELTAAEAAAEARAARLDFIAVTEHNRADTHGAWSEHAGDDLLIILGQEVTTRTGHWLALGQPPNQSLERRYGVRDDRIRSELRRVREAGGLCVAAHPYAPYPSGQLMYPFDEFDAVEVWNGLWSSDLEWNADNEAALAEWGRGLASGIGGGRWLPAVGNSDAHLTGQIGVPHTVVFAGELSAEAVLAGVRAGRSWIAGSDEVDLSLEVTTEGGSAGIGGRLRTSGETAVVKLAVRGVPGGAIGFRTDRGRMQGAALPEDGSGLLEWRTSAEESAFVRVEIRHPSGQMAAVTNPVFIDGP